MVIKIIFLDKVIIRYIYSIGYGFYGKKNFCSAKLTLYTNLYEKK